MSFEEMEAKNKAIQRAVEEAVELIEPTPNNKGIVGMEVNVKTLHELSEGLKTSMFKILFMGTFKNGKSTTINALLGEELLPVGSLATTAIITQVVYGENDSNAYVMFCPKKI